MTNPHPHDTIDRADSLLVATHLTLKEVRLLLAQVEGQHQRALEEKLGMRLADLRAILKDLDEAVFGMDQISLEGLPVGDSVLPDLADSGV